jgi:two-component system LytT family sensor kinase
VDRQQQRGGLRERDDHTGEVTAAARWRRRLTLTVWAFVFWTALGVFFASQIILLAPNATWVQALTFSLPRWYSWGLLTPLVLWTDRWIGAGRSLAARVAWHVPLAIGFTLLGIAIRLAVRPLRGAPLPPNVAAFFLERFYWDLLIYAVIAGVSISRDLARQNRQREAEAHALALQATDLERRLMEASLQSLRAQLHPHFLFNALNTISAFTETDPKMARRLMGQLGDLLRASLTHASRPLVSLGEELTFLDDYLAIELARFEGRLTVAVHADEDLLDASVPSFLLQPFVENSIRHGISRRLSGGHIEVRVTRDGATLKTRVRDNGVGLPPGWQFERNAGVGLRNVASRLEHLYGRPDALRVTPVAAGGVDIEIELPLTRVPAPPAVPIRTAATHS